MGDAGNGAGLERLVARRFPGVSCQIERIPAGLGERRFYRIRLDSPDAAIPGSLIARVEADTKSSTASPFQWLPEPSIEPIRTILEEAGLPVPLSYLHDSRAGIDLLEDVGSKTLGDVSSSTQREHYLEAAVLPRRIQAIEGSTADAPAFGRFFDIELIRTKAAKVIHWSWPGLLGRKATSDESEAIRVGFDAIAQLLEGEPRFLAHRDFKAENLHLVPTASGAERLVMIDVQGAFMAPAEYDLVCLLADLQVDLPRALVDEIREESHARHSSASARAESNRRFDALAVVRLSKDVAHIVDAARSRNDLRRWGEIPRGLSLLEEAVGRLEHTFPPARALSFVIHTLTQGARTSDIEPSREVP